MITQARRQESPVPRLRHREPCVHSWGTYKETIRITNESFDHSKHPYFIVRGCSKCHEKHVIDYRIE